MSYVKAFRRSIEGSWISESGREERNARESSRRYTTADLHLPPNSFFLPQPDLGPPLEVTDQGRCSPEDDATTVVSTESFETSSYTSSGNTSPDEIPKAPSDPVPEIPHPIEKPAKFTISKFLLSAGPEHSRSEYTVTREPLVERPSRSAHGFQGSTPKRSLSSLRRKSWMPSRSPSPTKQDKDATKKENVPPSDKRPAMPNRRHSLFRKKSFDWNAGQNNSSTSIHSAAEGPASQNHEVPLPSIVRRNSPRHIPIPGPEPAQQGPPSSTESTSPHESATPELPSAPLAIPTKPTTRTPSPVDLDGVASNAVHFTKAGASHRPLSAFIRQDSFQKEPPTMQDDPPEVPPLPKSYARHRPLSAYIKPAPPTQDPVEELEALPQLPQLPKSASAHSLPSLANSFASTQRAPPMPRQPSPEKISTMKSDTPRKRDELWGAFRTLDGDYQKFSSKSIALKANVVRASLLPFLRQYAHHPSTDSLRLEDLDRRANIFNKWWTGLLDMISGRNNLSISGTDRPAILDGIAGIMERPEWRLPPSPFCALKDRHFGPTSARSQSTTSLQSMSSDFLTDSVLHNVRNIFTQNLLSQMAHVVDKMSMKNASASVVAFAGKTCAYAFYFCPDVAEILVRLWEPSPDYMRRVLEANGIARNFSVRRNSTDSIGSAFPPNLEPLAFRGMTATLRYLRSGPPRSLLHTTRINWYGCWINRWSGRDSDLFYVFVKHFHILAADFLPPLATKEERMRAPGMLMVHAQVLVNLDSTIHRQANSQPDSKDQPPAPTPTFDDVLTEPDATASTIPMPPNAARQMAENRLIMLIRDFLSERDNSNPAARAMFAESFSTLLQACATRTSMYDHNACYTLCDFLEEALVILTRYEYNDPAQHPTLDWSFWLAVWRKMIDSQNTMTEIRLFAFLYSIWPLIAHNEKRKRELVMGFILDPEVFETRFNHWCPMVRAYFMRILCWRVARYDGVATELDREILTTCIKRLRNVYFQFTYLRDNDDSSLGYHLATSVTPCLPAPGRRLLIIRTDAPVLSGLRQFENIGPSGPSVPNSINRRLSTLQLQEESRPVSSASSNSDSDAEEAGRKKWGLLRTIIGTTTKARSKSVSPEPPKRTSVLTDAQRRDTSRSPSPPNKTEPTPTRQEQPAMPYRKFSFKFSLEYLDRRHAQPIPIRITAPRLPAPAHKYLQVECSGIFFNQRPVRPTGEAERFCKYSGCALAEWTVVVSECQSFFERRRAEGVPRDVMVETPGLGVEVLKRGVPG